MQSRNKETLHRRAQSPGCSHKGSSTLLRSSPQTAGSQTRRASRLNKNNYDTLITVLITAALVFGLMAPTAPSLHRWSPEASGARSDPVSLSSGKGWLCQAWNVPTAAAKCVYSCAASNIHHMPSLQCVMWGNQHFTGCQMMSKQSLAGSVKKKMVQILT